MPASDTPKPADPLRQELYQARRDIQLLHKQLDELLYSLSHDLRSPAMIILGFADLLAADLPNTSQNEPLRQYLDHIRSSAARQVTLLESLIGLARLIRQPMQIQHVDPSDLCRQVWQDFPEAQRARVVLEISPTPGAHADPTLLKILLHALLDNVIKFTANTSSPRARFAAQDVDGKIWYSLTDNGSGFPPESATRLFQPFRRLHSSKEFPGLGMGLVSAATIARRHGGEIVAEGEVDHGATIRFRLGED